MTVEGIICVYIERVMDYDIVRMSGFVFMVLCEVGLMKTFTQ